MLQTATGMCGGVWVARRCSTCTCELPQLRRAVDEAASFRLSVRVLSASIPALPAPGLLVRQLPRVEAALGAMVKETEPGQFTSGQPSASDLDACSKFFGRPEGVDCPWRFGDALTFTVRLADLRGPGLRLQLRTQSDIRMGPVQLELANYRNLGACQVDLRHKVLPACVLQRSCEPDGAGLGRGLAADCSSFQVWESPALVLACRRDDGHVVAHIAASFAITAHPDHLEMAISQAERPLAAKVVNPLMHLLQDPVQRWTRRSSDSEGSPRPNHQQPESGGCELELPCSLQLPSVALEESCCGLSSEGWRGRLGMPNAARLADPFASECRSRGIGGGHGAGLPSISKAALSGVMRSASTTALPAASAEVPAAAVPERSVAGAASSVEPVCSDERHSRRTEASLLLGPAFHPGKTAASRCSPAPRTEVEAEFASSVHERFKVSRQLVLA